MSAIVKSSTEIASASLTEQLGSEEIAETTVNYGNRCEDVDPETGSRCVLCVISALVYLGRSVEQARDRVLGYLRHCGGWAYGLEMVEAGCTARGIIYAVLSALEGEGLVERRIEPRERVRPGYEARYVYRLTDAGLSAARTTKGA